MVHFAYMPSPIPRQVRWKFVRSYIPSTSAFPETGAGRLLHHYFRGLLSVHLRYGLHARQVAFATLCTRGFSSLVASPAALIATGWSEPVPGRVYPRCGPAPSRRTRLDRQEREATHIAEDNGARCGEVTADLVFSPCRKSELFQLLAGKLYFAAHHQELSA
jgi:hypothetical protein